MHIICIIPMVPRTTTTTTTTTVTSTTNSISPIIICGVELVYFTLDESRRVELDVDVVAVELNDVKLG